MKKMGAFLSTVISNITLVVVAIFLFLAASKSKECKEGKKIDIIAGIVSLVVAIVSLMIAIFFI
jgi:hypothetical protein